jgi:hypothetical protein
MRAVIHNNRGVLTRDKMSEPQFSVRLARKSSRPIFFCKTKIRRATGLSEGCRSLEITDQRFPYDKLERHLRRRNGYKKWLENEFSGRK